MAAYFRDRNSTSYPEAWNFGFRVAMIPEPATVLLLGLGGVALLIKRKAKNVK